MVLGVRVEGELFEDCDVTLGEGDFESVAIAVALGIPLVCKKLCEQPCEIVVKDNSMELLLGDGCSASSPRNVVPVMLARRDGLPFSQLDCQVLLDFIRDMGGSSAVDSGCSMLSAFRDFILSAGVGIPPAAFLSIKYPVGSIVIAGGLGRADLNGKQGRVIRYTRDRVGVEFPCGGVALKPENLTLPTHAGVELAQVQAASAKDRQERGNSRREQVKEQQARQLVKSFIEAVLNDVPPLNAERELWGFAHVGEDKGLNDTVLGAWTGLIRYGLLGEDALVVALVANNVRTVYEEACRAVARDGFPSTEGIRLGVGNTIEELTSCCDRLASGELRRIEWDTME